MVKVLKEGKVFPCGIWLILNFTCLYFADLMLLTLITCFVISFLPALYSISGCIYGCRIVMVRALLKSSTCVQYCDEVVGQVMKNIALYGNDTIVGEDGNKKRVDRDRIWSQTCADSCKDTFQIRSDAGFADNKKSGENNC